MTGIVYTELSEFLEEEYGESAPPVTSDALFLERIQQVAANRELSAGALMRRFGAHLFARFVRLYPVFFDNNGNTLDFLEQVGSHVHDQLQTVAPGLRFPTLESRRLDGGRLELIYRSERHLADLAEGMIRGCADYFGESVELERTTLPSAGDETVRFLVQVKH